MTRYEQDHFSGKWIIAFPIALLVSGVITHFIIQRIERGFVKVDPSFPPRSAWHARVIPAIPLQPIQDRDRLPIDDLNALHAREEAAFDALGWPLDPTTHRRSIPDNVISAVTGGPR